MDPMIAFCGLDCHQCEAFIATQADDQAALARVAAQWREQFNAPDITPSFVVCDGCQSTTGRRTGYCGMCPIRSCATARGVANCSYCAGLDACATLMPDMRVRLVEMRALR